MFDFSHHCWSLPHRDDRHIGPPNRVVPRRWSPIYRSIGDRWRGWLVGLLMLSLVGGSWLPPVGAPVLAARAATPEATATIDVPATPAPEAPPPAPTTGGCPVALETCAFAAQVDGWLAARDVDALVRATVPIPFACPATGVAAAFPLCQGSQPGERRQGYMLFGFGSEGTLLSAEQYTDWLRSLIDAAQPARRDRIDQGALRVFTIGCPDDVPEAKACRDDFVVVVSGILVLPNDNAPRRTTLVMYARRAGETIGIRSIGMGGGSLMSAVVLEGGPASTFVWSVPSGRMAPGHFHPVGPPRQPRQDPTLVQTLTLSLRTSLLATDGDIVLWESQEIEGNGMGGPPVNRLTALRLADRRQVVIASREPASQDVIGPWAIGGGYVAWQWSRPTTGDLGDILAIEVASGQENVIAASDADESQPLLSGTRLAWLHRDRDQARPTRIQLRDLSTTAPPVSLSAPNSGKFSHLTLGDDGIAWVEITGGDPYAGYAWQVRWLRFGETTPQTLTSGSGQVPSVMGAHGNRIYLGGFHDGRVELFDAVTGAHQTIFQPPGPAGQLLLIGVTQRHLVWRDVGPAPPLQIYDLATGVTATVDLGEHQQAIVGGDYLVWLEHNSLQPVPELHAASIESLLTDGRPPSG